MNELLKNKKRFLFIVLGTVLLFALCVFIFILFNKSDTSGSNLDEDDPVIVPEVDKNLEKTIIEAYGVSCDDANDIVKGLFNGDIYEFKCEVNANGTYNVTVKNTLTNKIYLYEVKPDTKEAFEIVS